MVAPKSKDGETPKISSEAVYSGIAEEVYKEKFTL